MNNEKLIALVSKFQYLYNSNHAKYSDTVLKDQTWKEIACQMRQPVHACKEKWAFLRDAFRRVLRKRKLKTTSTSRKWRYEDEMQFILPYYLPKRKAKNEYFGWDDPDSGQILEMKFEDSSNLSEDMNISEVDEGTSSEKDALAFDAEKSNQAVDTTNVSESTPLKLSNNFGENSWAEPKLIQYDEIDHFFLSMSAVLKNFSPYDRAVTKKKIFDIVSEVELRQLSNSEQND